MENIRVFYFNDKFRIVKKFIGGKPVGNYELKTTDGEVLPSGGRSDMFQLKKFCQKQLASMEYDYALFLRQDKPRSARRILMRNSKLVEAYTWVVSLEQVKS